MILAQPSVAPPADPARIAVLQALYLGDLLCATPALRALRRRFPDSEIAFIGRPWAEDFLVRLGFVDRFVPFPGYEGIAESPDDRSFGAQFPAPSDLAVQMHGSGEISNGFVQSLAPRTVGFGPAGERRLSTALAWVDREPEPLRWLRLVDAVGAHHDGFQLDLPISPAERLQADRLAPRTGDAPRIGLHVGASDPARRWPGHRFAALADQLIRRYGARIVLTGAAGERFLTAAVRRAMRGDALDLAGKTSLGELGALIATLDLLITNDTGVSHVAAATRTHSVVLFGPTAPERWAPLDRKRHTVVRAVDFAAIQDGAAALAALPVAPVLNACCAALARRAGSDAQQDAGGQQPCAG
jgi:ADP-heptose:LPS heptosyltransferase